MGPGRTVDVTNSLTEGAATCVFCNSSQKTSTSKELLLSEHPSIILFYSVYSQMCFGGFLKGQPFCSTCEIISVIRVIFTINQLVRQENKFDRKFKRGRLNRFFLSQNRKKHGLMTILSVAISPLPPVDN